MVLMLRPCNDGGGAAACALLRRLHKIEGMKSHDILSATDAYVKFEVGGVGGGGGWMAGLSHGCSWPAASR
jgi:hypothetical protein